MRWLPLLLLLAWPMPAMPSDRAAGFDHYLLSLSWLPSWCATEGDARQDARCADGSGTGWALHGLWPQHVSGWPEYCRTPHRNPSRSETAAQAALYGSSGLAWHQWNKHGRCSGLPAAEYYALSAQALAALRLPELPAPGVVTPGAVVAAFLAENPRFRSEKLVLTCRAGRVHELRLCLTHGLDPRPCSADVLARACASGRVLFPAPR